MKNFWIDLCLVLLFMCVISLFFDDYRVSQTLFQRSVETFEERVEKEEVVNEGSLTLVDTHDNDVSTFFKGVSDGCVKVIQFIVLIFSNFVSMVFSVVVY